MKRVLFIAYHFPPLGGGGVQRSIKFVKYLPNFGYLPVVVTINASSYKRWTPEDLSLSAGIPRDIDVFRVNLPLILRTSRVKRFLQSHFHALDEISKCWIKSALEICKDILNTNPINIIYVSMSPFESSYVADSLSRKYGIPWVADLRDPWALDEMLVYTSWIHRNHEIKKMKTYLSSASCIIMNTPEARLELLRKIPEFRENKVITITNGYDEDDFTDINCKTINSKFRIVHTGSLHTELGWKLNKKRIIYKNLGGILKGVDILTRSHYYLVKAIEQWIYESPEVINDVELVFTGELTDRDIDVINNSNIKNNTKLIGYISHDENVNTIQKADLLFFPMHKLADGYRSTIVPGKLYEYLATGRPILAAVPEGDAKDFLINSGTSYIVAPDDVDGMLSVLKKIYLGWKNNNIDGTNPNYEYISKFERKIQTNNLATIFDELIETPLPRRRRI